MQFSAPLERFSFIIIIMNYVTPLRWRKKKKQSQYLQSVIIYNIMIYDPGVFVHICSRNTENGGKSHKDLLLGSNKIHSEWKLASCINSCTLKITFYSGLSEQFDVLSKVCIIFFIYFFCEKRRSTKSTDSIRHYWPCIRDVLANFSSLAWCTSTQHMRPLCLMFWGKNSIQLARAKLP